MTDQSMLERVARAIEDELYSFLRDENDLDGRLLPSTKWAISVAARAAIEAMQEPPSQTAAQRIASIIASCDNDEIAAERILREVIQAILSKAHREGEGNYQFALPGARYSYETNDAYADRIISEAIGKKE